MALIQMQGKKFGRWTVLSQATTGSVVKWYCVCDCGAERIVRGANLRRGQSTSCGCYRREVHTTHGARVGDAPLGKCWLNMRQRCNNPSSQSYKSYGARGITICEQWNDFAAFKAWAFSSGYKEDLTIERVNNDKGYSPENCTWVPLPEQPRNRRCNHVDEDGVLWLDHARKSGLSGKAFEGRLRLGWSFPDAAFLPPHGSGLLNVRQKT